MSVIPHRAYISLGSNEGHAVENLATARDLIAQLGELGSLSAIYLTEPQDDPDQPWFHNQVLELLLEDFRTPIATLRALLEIEAKMGRVRTGRRFGPRCIDLDLLLFDDAVSPDEECLLPHPRLTKRAFVLYPLAKIAPNLQIGGLSPGAWLDKLHWRLDGCRIFQTGSNTPWSKECGS